MGCSSNMTGVPIRRRRDTRHAYREKPQEDRGQTGCQPRRTASGGTKPPPSSLRNRQDVSAVSETFLKLLFQDVSALFCGFVEIVDLQRCMIQQGNSVLHTHTYIQISVYIYFLMDSFLLVAIIRY